MSDLCFFLRYYWVGGACTGIDTGIVVGGGDAGAGGAVCTGVGAVGVMGANFWMIGNGAATCALIAASIDPAVDVSAGGIGGTGAMTGSMGIGAAGIGTDNSGGACGSMILGTGSDVGWIGSICGRMIVGAVSCSGIAVGVCWGRIVGSGVATGVGWIKGTDSHGAGVTATGCESNIGIAGICDIFVSASAGVAAPDAMPCRGIAPSGILSPGRDL